MHCEQAQQQIAEMPLLEDAKEALNQHLLQCAPCHELFEGTKALHRAYAQLRDETAAASPSPRVEAHILAALNGHGHQTARHAYGWRWPTVGAIAATMIAIVLIGTHHGRPAPPSGQAVAAPAEAPFTAMPYVVPPAPYERTTVIRTQVPLQIMQYAGFELHDTEFGSTMKADVVYGEDGRILAVRPVSRPQNVSTKRMD